MVAKTDLLRKVQRLVARAVKQPFVLDCAAASIALHRTGKRNTRHLIRILPVNARKPGDLMVVPTSKASEVVSRGAGSPSAHFNSNILPESRSNPDF